MVISTVASSNVVTVVVNLDQTRLIIDCATGAGGRRCTKSSASLILAGYIL